MGWVYPQSAGFLWRESDLPDIVMRMVLRGWGVRVVAVGAGLAVLAGCSGDKEPVVTPSPSLTATETVVESPSPTPSPTPTELTEQEILEAIPEDARTEDFWGAQEFTRFFLELSQEIIASHDVRLFEALSAEECMFCTNSVAVVNAVVDDGVSVSGGKLTVVNELAQGGREEDGYWRVMFDVAIDKREFLDIDGDVIDSTAAQAVSATVLLRYEDARWNVIEVISEEASA